MTTNKKAAKTPAVRWVQGPLAMTHAVGRIGGLFVQMCFSDLSQWHVQVSTREAGDKGRYGQKIEIALMQGGFKTPEEAESAALDLAKLVAKWGGGK